MVLEASGVGAVTTGTIAEAGVALAGTGEEIEGAEFTSSPGGPAPIGIEPGLETSVVAPGAGVGVDGAAFVLAGSGAEGVAGAVVCVSGAGVAGGGLEAEGAGLGEVGIAGLPFEVGLESAGFGPDAAAAGAVVVRLPASVKKISHATVFGFSCAKRIRKSP